MAVTGGSGGYDYLIGNYIKLSSPCSNKPAYSLDGTVGSNGHIFFYRDTTGNSPVGKWRLSSQDCKYDDIFAYQTSDSDDIPVGQWEWTKWGGTVTITCMGKLSLKYGDLSYRIIIVGELF